MWTLCHNVWLFVLFHNFMHNFPRNYLSKLTCGQFNCLNCTLRQLNYMWKLCYNIEVFLDIFIQWVICIVCLFPICTHIVKLRSPWFWFSNDLVLVHNVNISLNVILPTLTVAQPLLGSTSWSIVYIKTVASL